ncbi:MAG: hypothetical protein HOC71_16780 [Candidatus Latescibacteria bacterium]|jgi:hypothetical protein|nr:hypothetical protein [Candidatus Latescibacterota bacterium]
MDDTKQKDFKKELQKRIKGDFSFDEVTLGIYTTDASIYQIKPVASCMPRDEDDVRWS